MSAALLAKLIEAGTPAALVAEVAMELGRADGERKALAERREHERQRKANQRLKSRAVTGRHVTSQDVPDPPKENIKPPASEANASADEPPQDPVKQLFDLGVTILTDAGIGKERARQFVGKLKQQYGTALALQALLECRAKNVSAPIDWLTKRLQVAKYVSPSGYEYKGDDRSVMREAEKRADWGTYYAAKNALGKAA